MHFNHNILKKLKKFLKKMPLPVIAAAGVAVGTYAYHAAKRANRKQGDKKLAKERTQQRDAELQQGGPSFPTPIQHCLHPHHDMILSDSAPDTKSCVLSLLLLLFLFLLLIIVNNTSNTNYL